MQEELFNSPFRRLCFDLLGKPYSLWRMLSYCSNGSDGLPKGVTLRVMLRNDGVCSFLREVVSGVPDVAVNEMYALWLPFVLLSREMVLLKGKFHARGVVPLAELLVAVGRYSGQEGDSLDGVSHAGDYWNIGYNACAWGYSSPFLGQYDDGGILGALTRFDLAFLVGVCWQGLAAVRAHVGFVDKYDVAVYRDGFRVAELKQDIREGRKPVPECVVASAARLEQMGLFQFGRKFDPFREVSRQEFVGFLFNLACMAVDGKILY